MHPDVVLFDLDGTLTDSGAGIARGVSHALRSLGLPALRPDSLREMIGPPLPLGFQTVAGLDVETAAEAVAAYRAYFAEHGLDDTTVYDGIAELLAALLDDGRRLAVATSKPQPVAMRVLDHLALTPFFDAVCGAAPDESRGAKHEVVTDALAALGVEPHPDVVLVGDREHDVLGAHRVGISCVGVAWGYGSPEEFRSAGADAVVADVDELAQLLGVPWRRAVPRDEPVPWRQSAEVASPSVGDEALA